MSVRKQLISLSFAAAMLVSTAGLALAYHANGRPASVRTASTVLVKVGKTSLGKVLVGAKGLTLYHRTTDNTGTVSCTGGCLTFWPPLLLPAGSRSLPAAKAWSTSWA
jgi:predicted lipoprotein with Yx(FWY)xxD motif